MIDGPYKLPKGWRWVRLGEVASEIQSGFAFRKKGARAGEVLHLRPYNIGNDGELKLDQQFKIPNTALPEHWSYLYPGDVLFNNTNSVELVGKTAIVKNVLQAVFSNHITRIRACLDKCEGEWLALALRTLWQQGFFAQQCNKWVGQAGYNTKMLKKTLIPLPPLNEQRRIVAKVEMLMEQVREARRLRQKAVEDADRLWQAVLADTFPRPGADLPPNWRWVRLGEACQINPRRPRLDVNPTTEVTFVPMSAVDVELGIIYTPEIKPFSAVKTGYTYFEENDVLFAKITPCMENGKSAVARGLLNNIGFGSTEFHVLRPIDSVLSEWIWLYVRKKDFRESARAAFRGGVGQQRVPAEFLQEACIPLPPLDVQRHVVAHLKTAQEKIKLIKDSQAQFEAELQCLEQSILDSAFKGEL